MLVYFYLFIYLYIYLFIYSFKYLFNFFFFLLFLGGAWTTASANYRWTAAYNVLAFAAIRAGFWNFGPLPNRTGERQLVFFFFFCCVCFCYCCSRPSRLICPLDVQNKYVVVIARLCRSKRGKNKAHDVKVHNDIIPIWFCLSSIRLSWTAANLAGWHYHFLFPVYFLFVCALLIKLTLKRRIYKEILLRQSSFNIIWNL